MFPIFMQLLPWPSYHFNMINILTTFDQDFTKRVSIDKYTIKRVTLKIYVSKNRKICKYMLQFTNFMIFFIFFFCICSYLCTYITLCFIKKSLYFNTIGFYKHLGLSILQQQGITSKVGNKSKSTF